MAKLDVFGPSKTDNAAASPAGDTPPAGRGLLPCRVFLRALADTIDGNGGAAARDELLRATGRHMARLVPLPDVSSLAALEIEMNEALAAIGWGSVALALDETAQSLAIRHVGLPRIGGAGDPPGLWLSAALEGLYETWIAQQPEGDPQLVAERVANPAPDRIDLRYGRL